MIDILIGLCIGFLLAKGNEFRIYRKGFISGAMCAVLPMKSASHDLSIAEHGDTVIFKLEIIKE